MLLMWGCGSKLPDDMFASSLPSSGFRILHEICMSLVFIQLCFAQKRVQRHWGKAGRSGVDSGFLLRRRSMLQPAQVTVLPQAADFQECLACAITCTSRILSGGWCACTSLALGVFLTSLLACLKVAFSTAQLRRRTG